MVGQLPQDSFGREMVKCEWWLCQEYIRDTGNQKFCSRGCKQAESKKRSRNADRTRERRREQGKQEGFENGHLYVIRPGQEDIVKIGYSKSLSERIRVLQTAHYHTLEAIGSLEVKRYFKNDPPDKAVHEKLREQDHVRGEWWRLTAHTVEVLEEVGLLLGGIS